MSVFYAAFILTLVSSIASDRVTPVPDKTHIQQVLKACKAGVVAVNECNKCVCTSEHFDCISKPCNQTVIQIPKGKVSCEPSMLYIKDGKACLCKENGFWPHEKCTTIFNSLHITSEDNNICKPNTFVIVDCNVCKCGRDGVINKKRCTKNKCEHNLGKSRRYIKQNQVYGSCEAQNWYYLAPCQFCFCISENKLVCNTGNNYSKKLQLGTYNLSICGKELIKDAINLIPDKKIQNKVLRFGIKKTANEPEVIEMTTEYQPFIELNRENNQQKSIKKQRKEHPEQQTEKNAKESEEYYTDSNEAKAKVTTGREGSSTKLPYEEDENNLSSDSDNYNQAPAEFALDIDPSQSSDLPVAHKVAPLQSPSISGRDDFPQHFEWTGPLSKNGQELSKAFNLGDVLKPYLPVVLDKVFQMALRKSMVSIDAHANCTAGATTVFKCNACFCMKNNKLLCTNNECK